MNELLSAILIFNNLKSSVIKSVLSLICIYEVNHQHSRSSQKILKKLIKLFFNYFCIQMMISVIHLIKREFSVSSSIIK